jgi:hypothetical protein
MEKNGMKKFSDLNEEDRGIQEDIIQANMGIKDIPNAINSLDRFGICATCDYLNYVESEFKIEFAKCSEFNIKRRENLTITNCSGYYKKGSMSIRDMQAIAYLIDKPKDKVGF